MSTAIEFRKPVDQITDRAKRYRANSVMGPVPRRCHWCKTTRAKQYVWDHRDGDESNTSPGNLVPACKSCNTKRGKRMAAAGQGIRTRQYNPEFSDSEKRELASFWHAARIAGARSFGDRVNYVAREWDRSHPGEKMRAYKYASSEFRGYGHNPAKPLPVGTKVKIVSKDSWDNGGWGIIKAFDGEHYHVAMYGGNETQPIFERRELKVIEKIGRKNPGATNLAQYVQAAVDHVRGAHDAGGAVIHETPKDKRREFAREIWFRRGYRNPMETKNVPHYRVTREFIGGALKGLTHTGVTSVPFKVGQVVKKPIGGSPYRITAIMPVAGSSKQNPAIEWGAVDPKRRRMLSNLAKLMAQDAKRGDVHKWGVHWKTMRMLEDEIEAEQGALKRNPTETVLYGLPKGATERYEEVLLLTNGTPERIAKAKELATRDGFHSFRVATIDLSAPPDFTKAVRGRRRNSNAWEGTSVERGSDDPYMLAAVAQLHPGKRFDQLSTSAQSKVLMLAARLKTAASKKNGRRNSVASVILEQLGGNRFAVMTGAKNFVSDGNSLRFKLPANFAKDGINLVRITLDPSDTYSLEFMKMRGTNVQTIATREGVYAEDLRKVFKTETGLDTSLGTMGRNPFKFQMRGGKPELFGTTHLKLAAEALAANKSMGQFLRELPNSDKMTPAQLEQFAKAYAEVRRQMAPGRKQSTWKVGDLVTFHAFDGKDYNGKVKRISRGIATIAYYVPGSAAARAGEDVIAPVSSDKWDRITLRNPSGQIEQVGADRYRVDNGRGTVLTLIRKGPDHWEVQGDNVHARVAWRGMAGVHTFRSLRDVENKYKAFRGISQLIGEQNPPADIMPEFHRGTLRSSSGRKVRKPSQARAILLSELRAAGRIPPRAKNPNIVDAIRFGDRVTIVNRFGQRSTGKAVMRSSTGGWVLNMGGKHGTPGLADEENIVSVKPSKRNPDLEDEDTAAAADGAYAEFHGADPDRIKTREVESIDPYNDHPNLWQLGKLKSLTVGERIEKFEGREGEKPVSEDPEAWATVIQFEETNAPDLAGEPGGNQLFIVGGNQNIDRILSQIRADTSKETIDAGFAYRIEYFTRKDFDKFRPVNYWHHFGEETGTQPRLVYDRANHRLQLAGGEYVVKREGIVN